MIDWAKSWKRIDAINDSSHWVERTTVVAVTDEERAAADEVDGILLIAHAEIAGLIEGEQGSKSRFSMAGPRGIPRHSPKEDTELLQYLLEPQRGILVAFVGPLLPRRLIGRHDGKLLG